jgi:predicted DNA-binding WGR domain protein
MTKQEILTWVGKQVVRGRTWHWGTQDNGTNPCGIVEGGAYESSPGVWWVPVQWANGNSYTYSVDGANIEDIKLLDISHTTRRFECRTTKSNKFWEISQDTIHPTVFTTHWGKIGTKGQEKTIEFRSEWERNFRRSKIIRSKIVKGYVEVFAPIEEPIKPEEPRLDFNLGDCLFDD